MKAQKITVTLNVEVLSLASVPALLAKAINNIDTEYVSGSLSADDGDTVTWNIKYKSVTI